MSNVETRRNAKRKLPSESKPEETLRRAIKPINDARDAAPVRWQLIRTTRRNRTPLGESTGTRFRKLETLVLAFQGSRKRIIENERNRTS